MGVGSGVSVGVLVVSKRSMDILGLSQPARIAANGKLSKPADAADKAIPASQPADEAVLKNRGRG